MVLRIFIRTVGAAYCLQYTCVDGFVHTCIQELGLGFYVESYLA